MITSSTLEFSGDDAAFLYPDIRTAMVGKFVDGKMMEAKHGEVCGIAMTSKGCTSACKELTTICPRFHVKQVKNEALTTDRVIDTDSSPVM